ncbi:dihydrofolate reductase [Salinarimonas chemoclinalis]|uniref:dihydrofolate reductase n=1 Tax=Salinarimonas chemoclinalis TaxID=3241599 RepID=UPI003556A108
MRPIVLVAAVARNGVIGRENQLAWRLRSDLRRFRALTMGKPLIMGRKTFLSIGEPLPGRETVVLTRDRGFAHPGVHTAQSFDTAMAMADTIASRVGASEIVVAGGAEVYALALPYATKLYLTRVEAEPEGDAVFPGYDAEAFREVRHEAHPAGPEDEHAFAFIDLERRAALVSG